jgi:hypothetical protein
VVNVEKSHFLNLIEILGSYLSIDLNGFAAFKSKLEVEPGKSRLAKKHVFGSSAGCRGGGCQTLACVGSPGISMKIMAFSVICRVIVMLV